MALKFHPRVVRFNGYDSLEQPTPTTLNNYAKFKAINGDIFLRHKGFPVDFTHLVFSILRETRASKDEFKNAHAIRAMEQFIREAKHGE